MISTATNTSQIIYETSCQLFQELWNGSPIRLLGIRTTKLTDDCEPAQLSLFDFERPTVSAATPSAAKLAALDETLDSIRKKYGDSAVIRGSLLKDKPPKD